MWDGAGFITRDNLGNKLDSILDRIPGLSERYKILFEKWRPGVLASNVVERHEQLIKVWQEWKKKVLTKSKAPERVILRFCLNDYYGAQNVKIELTGTSSGETVEIFNGVSKPSTVDLSEQPFYTRTYLLDEGTCDPTISITSLGYEGISLCYAKMILGVETYIPERISGVKGKVTNAEALLINDTTTCDIESATIEELMKTPALAEETSALRIHLKRESQGSNL